MSADIKININSSPKQTPTTKQLDISKPRTQIPHPKQKKVQTSPWAILGIMSGLGGIFTGWYLTLGICTILLAFLSKIKSAHQPGFYSAFGLGLLNLLLFILSFFFQISNLSHLVG